MTVLSEYDESWPAQYAEMAAQLRPIFDVLEHIGSTAVPGLVAKPVIDIAARAEELTDDRDGELAALGFRHEPAGPPGRRTYTRIVDDVLTHNLHVFPAHVWDELNQRILRDYLRQSPEAVREYGDLKRRLASEGLSGFDYTVAKTEVVQRLTDAARARLGLVSVPVWES